MPAEARINMQVPVTKRASAGSGDRPRLHDAEHLRASHLHDAGRAGGREAASPFARRGAGWEKERESFAVHGNKSDAHPPCKRDRQTARAACKRDSPRRNASRAYGVRTYEGVLRESCALGTVPVCTDASSLPQNKNPASAGFLRFVGVRHLSTQS